MLWKIFSFFLKKSFPNFQEMELSYISGKTLAYLELEENRQISMMESFAKTAT